MPMERLGANDFTQGLRGSRTLERIEGTAARLVGPESALDEEAEVEPRRDGRRLPKGIEQGPDLVRPVGRSQGRGTEVPGQQVQVPEGVTTCAGHVSTTARLLGVVQKPAPDGHLIGLGVEQHDPGAHLL